MDERLLRQIELARRELHIAEGIANEDELRVGALDQQMEVFRNQVNASLDLQTTYLLGIEFARDQEGPVARLTADGIGFELRRDDNHDLMLRESDNKRILLLFVAGERQSANRIVCAIADSLATARQSA